MACSAGAPTGLREGLTDCRRGRQSALAGPRLQCSRRSQLTVIGGDHGWGVGMPSMVRAIPDDDRGRSRHRSERDDRAALEDQRAESG